MWFKVKQDAAPIYRDELHRRMFATASGRPKGAEKLKELKPKEPKPARRGLLAWLFGRGDRRSANRKS